LIEKAQRNYHWNFGLDTQVIIVGAGPVGLTLAVDLGRRGVRCILLEQKDAPQFLPKMERCNARTMEIYRRLGIAQKIRDAGFPRDVPMDVFIITSLVEPPLLHLPYPSVAQAQAGIILTAHVEDPDRRVTTVKVFFRGGGANAKGKFAEETMLYDANVGSVRGIFPASAVRPPFVTYYLLAQDKNGVPIAATGDADAPLRIPVPDEEKNNWLLPVAIGGGIVGVAGLIVGTLAITGAFK